MRRPPRPRPGADPLALDDATVERLLSGTLRPADAPPGYAAVAQLLAAVAAPPTPRELAGQAAVLAELRSLAPTRRPATTAGPASPPRRRRRRAGLAVVVVVGALATGGAAAATTGHLPGPVRDAARSLLAGSGGQPATTTPPEPAPVTQAAGSGGPGVAGPAPTGPAGTASDPTGASATTGPDLEGLCRAYLAGKGGGQGQHQKLDATGFKVLAAAAGGTDKLDGYCEDLVPTEAKPGKGKDPKQQNPPGGGNQGQGSPSSTTGGPPASTGPPPTSTHR